MITGIGTDIVEVKRIEEKIQKNESFVSHVFSLGEIEYCSKQKTPSMHYAARWAVKEAFLKAFGVNFIGNHKLTEIEVKNHDNGKPYIELSGRAKDEFANKGFTKIHVSISHTHHHAMAYIIIEA